MSIVSLCSDSIMSAGESGLLESTDLGWATTWEGKAKDGMCVEMNLFGDNRSSRVSFPNNFLWNQESIESALKAAGFGQIEWTTPLVVADGAPETDKSASFDISKTPIGVFVARRM